MSSLEFISKMVEQILKLLYLFVLLKEAHVSGLSSRKNGVFNLFLFQY